MNFTEEFTTEEKIKIKNEFKRLKDSIYFDNAGASLYADNQMKIIFETYTSTVIANPHTSKTSENLIDQVRYRILKHFNANPDEYSVIFTSGATAALKIVGECFEFNDGGSFYYLTDSHTSVLGLREIVQTKNIIPVLRNELDEIEPNNSLIAFPAQCNFNGYKFPLNIIQKFHSMENNFILLDAAAFVATNQLDLTTFYPDYVSISFYKIFGYPTGLGALLVSKRGELKLNKSYYGGGTVKIALTRENWHVKRDSIHEKFEDGTISFLSIISLLSSFKFMENLFATHSYIERVSRHVFNLAKYLYDRLKALKYENQQPVARLYHNVENVFNDNRFQGGIVNFNIKHDDGSYVGYAEFSCIAALNNFIIRTGCFCNPGACQTHLNLTNEEVMRHFNAGHVCGDENDLVDGMPTGSIRVSFGYWNTRDEVDTFIAMINSCYVQKCAIKFNRDEIRFKYRLNKTRPVLKSIRIFPIKSCAPIIVFDEWQLTQKGLKYDREWMIINGNNGTALTQKHMPKMCLIKPNIDEDRNILKLEFPGKNSIVISLNNEIALKRNASICESKVCGDRITGYDCGDEIACWLSDALKVEGLRLLRQSDETERKNGIISLSNQAQFLLISEPSVKWLMKYVEEWDIEQDVDNIVDRFRGNLIIDDVEALEENEWKSLKIGENEFEFQGQCTRCQMICIDQHSGDKTTEPLRTIGKIFQGKTRFGIYLKLKNFNSVETLKCNEQIYVVK